MMLSNILTLANLVLAQTEDQKRMTLILVGIFAFIGCSWVFDGFAKSKFVGDKVYKKVLMFVSIFFIALFFILAYAFNKK